MKLKQTKRKNKKPIQLIFNPPVFWSQPKTLVLISVGLLILTLGTFYVRSGSVKTAVNTGGGTAQYSDAFTKFGDTYTYSISGAPANSPGKLCNSTTGCTTGLGWITTDASGSASKGPWTCTQEAHATGIYIEWENGSSTNESEFYCDLTDPGVTVSAPSANATVQGNVTVSGSASDNFGLAIPASYTLYIDGFLRPASFQISGNNFSFTYDTTALANGSHTFTIKTLDRAGNEGAGDIALNVNNQVTSPGEVTITSQPPNGTTINDYSQHVVTVSDPDNVVTVVKAFFPNTSGAFVGQGLRNLSQPGEFRVHFNFWDNNVKTNVPNGQLTFVVYQDQTVKAQSTGTYNIVTAAAGTQYQIAVLPGKPPSVAGCSEVAGNPRYVTDGTIGYDSFQLDETCTKTASGDTCADHGSTGVMAHTYLTLAGQTSSDLFILNETMTRTQNTCTGAAVGTTCHKVYTLSGDKIRLNMSWVLNDPNSTYALRFNANDINPATGQGRFLKQQSCYVKASAKCGSANGQSLPSAPTTNLCGVGTASAVTGTGPWNWTCRSDNNADSQVSCSANKAVVPVNGMCGSANGAMYGNSETFPTASACSQGSLINLNEIPDDIFDPNSGSTIFWNCAGLNGGTASPVCSATRRGPPINGVCGTANGKTYPHTATSYGNDTQCAAGISNNTAFPAPGNSVRWICSDINDGINSPECIASRSSAPVPTCAQQTNLGLTVAPALMGNFNGSVTLTPSGFSGTPTYTASVGNLNGNRYISPATSGPVTFTARGTASNGALNCSATASVTVDRSTPTVSFQYVFGDPPNNNGPGQTRVSNFTIQDTGGSHLKATGNAWWLEQQNNNVWTLVPNSRKELTLTSSALDTWTVGNIVTPTVPGTYRVMVQAIDNVDNSSQVPSQSFTVAPAGNGNVNGGNNNSNNGNQNSSNGNRNGNTNTNSDRTAPTVSFQVVIGDPPNNNGPSFTRVTGFTIQDTGGSHLKMTGNAWWLEQQNNNAWTMVPNSRRDLTLPSANLDTWTVNNILPPASPGTYRIVVSAIDNANNANQVASPIFTVSVSGNGNSNSGNGNNNSIIFNGNTNSSNPFVPRNIVATASPFTNEIFVRWDPVNSTRVTGYNVYRSSCPGQTGTCTGPLIWVGQTAGAVVLLDTTAVSGNWYVYYVTSLMGSVESNAGGPSNRVQAGTPGTGSISSEFLILPYNSRDVITLATPGLTGPITWSVRSATPSVEVDSTGRLKVTATADPKGGAAFVTATAGNGVYGTLVVVIWARGDSNGDFVVNAFDQNNVAVGWTGN